MVYPNPKYKMLKTISPLSYVELKQKKFILTEERTNEHYKYNKPL